MNRIIDYAISKNVSSILEEMINDCYSFVSSYLNEKKNTLLQAVHNNSLENVTLLQTKVNLEFEDASGRTALYYAISEELNEILKSLISASARIDYFPNGFSPLQLSAERGNSQVCSYLVSTCKVPVDDKRNGFAALHVAILNHRTSTVEHLVEELGADLNAVYPKNKQTAYEKVKVSKFTLDLLKIYFGKMYKYDPSRHVAKQFPIMSTSVKFGQWLSSPPPGEEVVITGISGRFPECNNVREFQENLFNKIDMVTDIGRRWNLDHPEIPKRSGQMYNLDKIDAGHFGLHYRQTDIIDPMMRKLLETAVEAIMDAGVNPSELIGSKTGVFVGACYADMESETLCQITQPQQFGVSGYLRTFVPNRVSYFLKLRGPSLTVDTACSSSLNALELALKAIRAGRCENALVAGGNLLMYPGTSRQFFRLGMLCYEGVAKIFDEKADGYVRGESISCLFVQKAKNARRIYAKIICARVNSDGAKYEGITFPSAQMQKELICESLEDSGVDPSEISFLEAHATGTKAGDPQEITAIDGAIAQKRAQPLLIGSVKCSIGHTEPTSGICSLVKAIFAMETGYIAPNIHLNNIKKELDGFQEGRMKVVTELTELVREDAIIGINNFGFGGNNCHLLIRRFEKTKTNKGLPEDDVPRLVCVSGRTEEAVTTLLEDVNQRPLDAEYVGLLHQIFKEDIAGHIYRGFTILSKSGTIESDWKPCFQNQSTFNVLFGQFKNGYKILGPYLMEFPCFETIINKITDLFEEQITRDAILKNQNKIDTEVFGSFSVQIGITEILKLLELHPTAIYSDSLGKVVSAYYCGDITLEDAAQKVYKMVTAKDTSFEPSYPVLGKTSQTTYKKYLSNKSKDLMFDDSLICATQSNTFTDSIILNVSDKILKGRDILLFKENKEVKFLEVLGRLYERGFNPRVDKLYPSVQYPVSRGTPMISPLLKWDYRKSWYTYSFGTVSQTNETQQVNNVYGSGSEESKYLTGHIVDGRNLLPATLYLNAAWKTFRNCWRITELDNLPIVFENCRFIKALTLPKNEILQLVVSIHKGSGNFEVVEKDSVVVTGRIFSPKNIKQYESDLPPRALAEERSEYLEQDEIYKELNLRGYKYSGLFKGIVKSNIDASAGLIQWENNWITFIDKMLQFKILQIDDRLLCVPVGIKRLIINPLKHMISIKEHNKSLIPINGDKETKPESLSPVSNYSEADIIKSGGVEICGIKATSISKKKHLASPVLEKYVFVPNNAKIDLTESTRINTQIILENSLERKFKAVEIIDDFTKPQSELLLPLVCEALNDLPSILQNLTVSTKATLDPISGINIENVALTPTSQMLLIIATNIFQRPNLLKQALSALSPNGFLLSREEINFIAECDESIEILTEHTTDNEKLILLRNVKQLENTKFVEVTSKNLDWLLHLQKSLKDEPSVVVYSENQEPEGIMGLTNCLRREPGGSKVRCFFTMDEAPKFDSKNPFYEKQIKKQMAMNIWKDNEWGTYRHLPLHDIQEKECEHIFLNNAVRGNLASLKWFEGPLSTQTKMNKNSVLVFSYCSAINFKDVMIASGRINPELFAADRIRQECCLGFEYSGLDTDGHRVMGMASDATLSTMTVANTNVLWHIPDDWTFEDASTIPVVYGTVIAALFGVIKMKRGTSILIHSATGGVGLAALNVCLFYDCEIYLTVGTEEKKDYLKKHYPQIPESHIGNSRDTSFEKMIVRETKGRGVDVVLNSLVEEKLKASIRCMASGGDFLEIGKYDLSIDTSLELLLFERNVTYHGIMLDHMMLRKPEIGAWIVDKVYEGIKLGYVKPLPRTVFRPSEAVEAFKFMSTGKHIGKIVIQMRDEKDTATNTVFLGVPRFSCNPEKSYIIVGGLGGFGLELADWLYLRGAKKIILVSRTGIQTGYQNKRISHWKSNGITVQISTSDVTTKQGCIELIDEVNKLGPVDGIFNLAVVLKDALFEDQTQETFEIPLTSKAQSTIHLDEISRQSCPQLRYFVAFSSVSCGRGNVGQTNYGTANSIMERICEKRNHDGLPGLAIQWGAIGDVGLVAKLQKDNKELIIGGTLQQKISSCLEVLDKLLMQDSPIVASMIVAEKDRSFAAGSAVDAVMYILGIKDIKTVNLNATFPELGMDSIMGTELIQVLEKDFNISIAPKELRYLTFAKLMELEAAQKQDEGIINKVEKGIDILLKYIPRQDISDAVVINIPSAVNEDEAATTVFVLPGIEGIFEPLELLTKNLKAHVLGIQYGYSNPEASIEERANTILDCIEETIKQQGSFSIIGYSFGAIVATELAALLEMKGYAGLVVAIEGTPEYLATALRQNIPPSDNEFQTQLLLRLASIVLPINLLSEQKDKLLNLNSFYERCELLTSLVPSDVTEKQDFNKEVAFAWYNRFKSTLNYKFTHKKNKSQVYLFKAKTPLVTDLADDYQLTESYEQLERITVVEGNHVTLLNQDELVNEVNSLISNRIDTETTT